MKSVVLYKLLFLCYNYRWIFFFITAFLILLGVNPVSFDVFFNEVDYHIYDVVSMDVHMHALVTLRLSILLILAGCHLHF